MGVFDKMLGALRLDDDEEYYEEYDEEELEEEVEAPAKKGFFFKKTGTDDIEEEALANVETASRSISRSSSSKITPMRQRKAPSSMEVCVIKPQSFEDSRDIAETLLAQRTVILNMEGLDLALAQRIIDFISGSCFAVSGNLQKISSYIFIVTPHSVDISGDLQSLVDAFDFSGLQTAF